MENTEVLEKAAIARKIKEAATNFGADVVGIAPALRWDEYVPEGYRPYDLLPDAKSVIVVGARGPTAGGRMAQPEPSPYGSLGSGFC